MSILSDAQKSELFGRLLGLPQTPSGTTIGPNGLPTAAPERVAPTGTVAGYLPGFLGGSGSGAATLLIGLVAVLGVVYLAKKVL